ncbi:MAG: chorismate mutase [Actinomycetota bacterium]
MSEQRLRALRGAITVGDNEADSIIAGTAELLEEMLNRNEVASQDLVSVIFTTTRDLTAEFPAAAARKLGISEVPLLCAQEIDVPGSVPRCIRVLMHVYTSRDHDGMQHVYLGDAKQLRTDLPG